MLFLFKQTLDAFVSVPNVQAIIYGESNTACAVHVLQSKDKQDLYEANEWHLSGQDGAVILRADTNEQTVWSSDATCEGRGLEQAQRAISQSVVGQLGENRSRKHAGPDNSSYLARRELSWSYFPHVTAHRLVCSIVPAWTRKTHRVHPCTYPRTWRPQPRSCRQPCCML
jgi:hypothetical protein